jgi:transcriptional regulator with XRE-family HTH domain
VKELERKLARDETAEFGQRIARARRELGLTQRELADRIGVMLGVLEAYEMGRADPSPHLDRIAEATGKDALWFLRGEDPEELVARLQRHASELAKREAALQQQEEELALARRRAEARLEGAPADDAGAKAAVEAIERRQAELEGWARTADRVATELRESLATLVRLMEEASTDGAGPATEQGPPESSERESALLAREERLAAREAACKELELELQRELEEARQRARLQEERWRTETEAFAQLKRLEGDLEKRMESISRAEADLEERGAGLAHEERELEAARAAAEQRLAGVQEGIREAMAQLEAQLANELANGPRRTFRSRLRRKSS